MCRPTKDELSPRVGGLPLAVTSALTTVALIAPERRFTPSIVELVSPETSAELTVPFAVSVIVPDLSTAGGLTTTPVFLRVLPLVPRQGMYCGKDFPATTVLPTLALVPKASPVSTPLTGPLSELFATETLTCVPDLACLLAFKTTRWMPMTDMLAEVLPTWGVCWFNTT